MVAERGIPPQERIPEKICEQIVRRTSVPQVVEQVIEVCPRTQAKTETYRVQWSRFRMILVPEVVRAVGETVENRSPEIGVQQRTVEHIAADTPVPQVCGGTGRSSSKAFLSGQRFNSALLEQTIPAIPLAEKIVELLVIQTEGTTQRGVNTHVQHIVSAVEVEKSEILEDDSA